MKNGKTPFQMNYKHPRHEAVHPGRIISDILEHFHISQKEFSLHIGVCSSMVNRILMGKAAVNPRFALLTEAATGLPAELLMEMQGRHELWSVRHSDFQKGLDRIQQIEAVKNVQMPENISDICTLYSDIYCKQC